MKPPKFGETFFLSVADSESNGDLYNFEVDGHRGVFASESVAVEESRTDAEEYQQHIIVYHCVPVVRITPLPRSTVERFTAQGIEAPSGGETQSGSTEGESPVAEGHAPEHTL